MTNLTLDMMRRQWPHGNDKIPGLIESIVSKSPELFLKYGMQDNLIISHFMAQISHECGAGLEVIENLNYSAERMTQVWPSRFPNVSSASPYAHNPRALANKVYNGRMGNIPGTDDGYNFRGRGATQTTGREGYEKLGKSLNLPLSVNPDLVNNPEYFLECGIVDFILCGCLPYAQKDDILNVTKRLNGGTVGLDQRTDWLKRWKREFAAEVIAAPLPRKPSPPSQPEQIPTQVPPVAKEPQVVQNVFVAILQAILSIFKRK